MAKGDHIKVGRGFYSHHGIDLGDGRVIHYSGRPGHKAGASVRIDSMTDFADGGTPEVVARARPQDALSIERRAKKRLGERNYSLTTNNCEHFAEDAFRGEPSSSQVKAGVAAAGILAIGAIVLRQFTKR